MTAGKQTGLGDNLYVGGYDLSGDIQAIDTIGGGPAALDVTAIDKSAHERLGGRFDGQISTTAFFNPDTARAHPVLAALSTADVLVTYARGTSLGSPAACTQARQVNYDPTRGSDGSLTMKSQFLADGYGVQWGTQLTAGLRTDTAATSGAAVDLTDVSTDFGASAYLQVTDVQGTDVTVKIQDSADGTTGWADVGLSFTALSGSSDHTAERISTSSTTENIRRYARAVTTTTGGFTSATFSVVLVRNLTAVTL